MNEGFDIEALLEQARVMQDQLRAAQAEAAERVVEGQAGGGVVKVRVSGDMDFQSVSIDPQDVSMLEDLMLAACNDAVAQARSVGQEAMGGLDLGGLDLGASGPGVADLGGPELGGPGIGGAGLGPEGPAPGTP